MVAAAFVRVARVLGLRRDAPRRSALLLVTYALVLVAVAAVVVTYS
jgi:hypothetical protein